MNTLAEFSRALSERQKELRMTTKELAERTGLSVLAVRQILSGQTAPRLTNAMAVASELGLELALLPKGAAKSIAAGETSAPRTVLTDVERSLGLEDESKRSPYHSISYLKSSIKDIESYISRSMKTNQSQTDLLREMRQNKNTTED